MATTLQERATAASERAARKARREAEAKRKAFIREAKPKAAAAMTEVVGRRVAQKAIEATATGSDGHGKAVLFFTYDGIEFSYGPDGEGLYVRRRCPDCGGYIRTHVYSYGFYSHGSSGSDYALAQIGRFLKKPFESFEPYEHACNDAALKALRREAESYARHGTASAEDLLLAAATEGTFLR